MFTSQQFGTQLSGNPDRGWLSSLSGHLRSSSGVNVSPEKAMSLITYQACVSLIAESVAQLPCELYKRNGDQRDRAIEHPVYSLVHDQPNGWQTAYEFTELSQIWCGKHGNSYAFIERGEDGRPTALIPMDPNKTAVFKGGDLMPYYRFDGGELMPQRMVHHVRWFSDNAYLGLSPVALHCESIGLALATNGHASNVFANGTNLAGVLERPAMIGQEVLKSLSRERVDEIKQAWQAEYSGFQNAKRVAVLQDGISFKPLAMTNEDAQLIDARKLSSLELAQIFKVPPHKVGLLDRATNNNIEQQAIEFVVYCLMPWIKRREQAMSRDFLLPKERSEYFIEYNVSGLLRGDQASRYTSYAVGRQWGWLSVNDIRRLENLPPVQGGDTYLQPVNMAPAGFVPNGYKPSASAVSEVEQALSK